MRARNATRVRVALRRFLRNDHVVLSVLALAVGLAAGFGAVAFRLAISGVQWLGFGVSEERLITGLAGTPWWLVVVVPTAGGLVIGLFRHFVMGGARAEGVPHVIEAAALNGGRMSLRTGLASAVVHAVSLGAGASTGREGPVVHLGATLAGWMVRKLHLSRSLARTLIGCGVASAVAASFNAPIAGVFFALEVVIGHHATKALAPIVVAAVAGTVIGRIYFGAAPAFDMPGHLIISLWEFPAFAILGLVCAVAAIAFMASTFLAEDVIARIRWPEWTKPACGGVLVGAIAVFYPQVLGVGYEATDAALRAEYGLILLLVLVAAKGFATAISLGAGFGGGVFSPSLFLGAMVGGAYGVIAGTAFPEMYSGVSAYAVIGMGAVAGAVLGAPMSTILIIFELTGDYQITIAVMIATAIATLVVQQVYGRSFFHRQLERRGIELGGGHDLGLLRSLQVGDVMSPRFDAVRGDCAMGELRHRLEHAPYGELFVLDEAGRLLGVLTYADLHRAVAELDDAAAANALDVARRNPPVLVADDDLARALEVMQSEHEEHVPVVADRDSLIVVGFLHDRDAVHAYNRALLQARQEEQGLR